MSSLRRPRNVRPVRTYPRVHRTCARTEHASTPHEGRRTRRLRRKPANEAIATNRQSREDNLLYNVIILLRTNVI